MWNNAQLLLEWSLHTLSFPNKCYKNCWLGTEGKVMGSSNMRNWTQACLLKTGAPTPTLTLTQRREGHGTQVTQLEVWVLQPCNHCNHACM